MIQGVGGSSPPGCTPKMEKEKKLIPNLPSGFLDYKGDTLELKKRIIKIIEDNFINFGYSALEQSIFEKSENIGSFLADDLDNPMADVYSFEDNKEQLTYRYDMTAGLARMYAANYLDLPSIYKRYCIGSVARREKPQKKIRLKSFEQADCDIIGNVNKYQANAELCNLIADTLFKLNFKKEQFKICISNRKIIEGLINDLKITDEKQKLKVFRAIDKISNPNIGISGVKDLLGSERTDKSGAIQVGANLSIDQIDTIINSLQLKNLKEISSVLKNPLSKEGIIETEKLLEILDYGKYFNQIKLSIEKVRGINYYSGWLVETELNIPNFGSGLSVCSGGEYRDLIGSFKGLSTPGVGISFGVTRLTAILSEINQLNVNEKKPVLVCIMDTKYLSKYYQILEELRSNGVNSEIYLDSKKNLSSQLKYANKRELPLAIICGEDEFKKENVTIKNLLAKKGEKNQTTVKKENLINEVKKYV